MTTHLPVCAACLLATLLVAPLAAQQAPAPTSPKPSPKDTEVWEPEPVVVTPGASSDAAPSDAIVLFGGQHLDEWVNVKGGGPAGWTVADGVFTVDKRVGNIQTKRSFTNYQLHLEWRVPASITSVGPPMWKVKCSQPFMNGGVWIMNSVWWSSVPAGCMNGPVFSKRSVVRKPKRST